MIHYNVVLYKISAETCYGLAIKNEFAAHAEDVSVDNIIELISKIEDFSVAISAAKWAVKQLKLPKDGKNCKYLTLSIPKVRGYFL